MQFSIVDKNLKLLFSSTYVVFIIFSTLAAHSAQLKTLSISDISLANIVKIQEEKLNARIGVSIVEKGGAVLSSWRGEEVFPLNSTQKPVSCAALLSLADQQKINLQQNITFTPEKLVSYSPITKDFVKPKYMNWYQLCSAAVSFSDNTAANFVIENSGGAKGITNFLRKIGDNKTRLDRLEPALNSAIPGDPRDTTTPNAISETFNKIIFGDVLKSSTRGQLITWMRNDAVADDLLRASLPKNWSIADKSGAGAYGSRSIIAAVWPENKKSFIISVYITDTKASIKDRNAAIAHIGKSLFK